MSIPSADEIVSLSVDDLKELRSRVTDAQRGRPPEAYFQFLVLMTAVQDMREWSRLAEPGMAPKVAAAGWDSEVEQAREMDRLTLESHRESVGRFEALGGKPALQRAVDGLNG